MSSRKDFFKLALKEIYPEREIYFLYRIVMEHILKCSFAQVLVKEDDSLTVSQNDEFLHIIDELKKEKPIQYILGQCDFCGITLDVNPNVLIPRPETAELVEFVVEENKNKKGQIIDIGTGSGCIAVSLAKKLPEMEVTAIDISVNALQTAKSNAKKYDVDIKFLQYDILNSKENIGLFDIIVSNPPYIRESEKQSMKKNVLCNEPHLALFVKEEEPLAFYEAIAYFGIRNLRKGGYIYFEINENLGNETCSLLQKIGYENIILKKDSFEKNRIVKCRKN